MRRALDPPEGSTVVLTTDLLAQAIAGSRSSPRRRVILPLHPRNDDNLHRMLNAVQPGTYIRPHRHLSPPKAESIVLLRGSIHFVVFEDDGSVRSHAVLATGSASFGIDIKPGVYHTFLALEPDTVLFEVKPGPYEESTDKDFAPWAPAEGSEQAAEFLRGIMNVVQRP
ncbi:MAG: WbuC family cupin fold metalloprotein [Acidobacteria bacterium]|nr:WbuC family cupin fold metalloprotein [Acidobacteriota bacterium]